MLPTTVPPTTSLGCLDHPPQATNCFMSDQESQIDTKIFFLWYDLCSVKTSPTLHYWLLCSHYCPPPVHDTCVNLPFQIQKLWRWKLQWQEWNRGTAACLWLQSTSEEIVCGKNCFPWIDTPQTAEIMSHSFWSLVVLLCRFIYMKRFSISEMYDNKYVFSGLRLRSRLTDEKYLL